MRERAGAVVDTVRRTGLFDPLSMAALGWSGTLWGPTPAAAYGAAALRYPNRIAIVDDFGPLTYGQLELRSGVLASGLRKRGLSRGDGLGILCRNHRGFVEATLAAAKLGARPVLLNTGLPPAQLRAVIEAESVSVVVADHDLAAPLTSMEGPTVVVLVADPERNPDRSFPDLDGRLPALPRPRNPFAAAMAPIILTSGTTGAPKGTQRSVDPRALRSAFGVLEAIPYNRGDVMAIPAPLFHAWGFSHLALAATLAATVVLRRRFDPETVLADLDAHGATVLVAVPVMLQRILTWDAGSAPTAEIDEVAQLDSLRIVASSGAPLPGDLATRWMDRFGDNLYNLYGSTECGQVSVAEPADLRRWPTTAGRPLPGIDVRILDGDDDDVDPGDVGEILVDSPARFDGYTNGEQKRSVGNLLSSGDRGYIDEDGLLFVLGRADDMIISGGENVYPSNIERALLADDAVEVAAVVGVADDDLGQRVRAVVVTGGPDQVVDPSSAGATTRRLKAALRHELAGHEMPKEFVYVSELPRNQAGKVLRNQLVGSRRSVPNQIRKPAISGSSEGPSS
ncbi:MAG: AMP-binding protein [Actinomycetota bacterium]